MAPSVMRFHAQRRAAPNTLQSDQTSPRVCSSVCGIYPWSIDAVNVPAFEKYAAYAGKRGFQQSVHVFQRCFECEGISHFSRCPTIREKHEVDFFISKNIPFYYWTRYFKLNPSEEGMSEYSDSNLVSTSRTKRCIYSVHNTTSVCP